VFWHVQVLRGNQLCNQLVSLIHWGENVDHPFDFIFNRDMRATPFFGLTVGNIEPGFNIRQVEPDDHER
jgi:hypothetical protein